MGDRANCVVLQNETASETYPPVWLYTHWGGEELPGRVQAGLKKGRERWSDVSYLTRIIFGAMIAGEEGETNGFGISTWEVDGSYDYLVVDVVRQEVRFEPELGTPREVYTFEAYCAVDRPEWPEYAVEAEEATA